MKKAEKEILVDVLGTTLNLPADKVESLFTQTDPKSDEFEFATEAKKTILDANIERVKTFKEKETEEFQKGFKKAKKEERSALEKEIKDKFPDVKSEKIGLELIEDIITSKTKAPELEADKVKLHPEFLNLEKETNKRIKELEAEWKQKFDARETELAEAATFSNVTAKAMSHLKTLNPILPSDEKKAANQLKLLQDDLKGYKYTDNNGEIVITTKEGKRLEDAHGKPITFETLIHNQASQYWDFAQGEDRSGSGASNDAAKKAAIAAGKKFTGTLPKNDEEFTTEMNKLVGHEHADARIELLDAYEASQKAAV